MGPRAEQGILAPSDVVCEKTPLLGDAPVAVLLPIVEPDPADKLSAKELAEFVSDPFWRSLRLAFFFGYWIIFFALLLASLSLSVSHCHSSVHDITYFSDTTSGIMSTPPAFVPLHASLAPKPA